MINLDELKKKYEELSAKQDKTNNKDRGDSPFLKLEAGANVIRILPPKEDGLPFYTHTKIHTVKDSKGGFKYWHCRTIHSEPCPLCDAYRELWERHNKVCKLKDHKPCDVPYGKGTMTIKGKDRYYVNCVNRKDDTIKIASFPDSLWIKVMSCILGNEKLGLEPLGDITDLQNGYDFNIIQTDLGGYANYNQSVAKPRPTPAGATKLAIAGYMDSLLDLKAQVRLEDFTEMKKAADTILAVNTVAIAATPAVNTEVKSSEQISDEQFKNQLKG